MYLNKMSMFNNFYRITMMNINIELLKRNKKLKPYFLWFIKSRMLMPTVISSIFDPKLKAKTSELIWNYESSQQALFKQLEKTRLQKDDYYEAIAIVCNYYVDKFGKMKIMNSNPELIIVPSYSISLN